MLSILSMNFGWTMAGRELVLWWKLLNLIYMLDQIILLKTHSSFQSKADQMNSLTKYDWVIYQDLPYEWFLQQ